MSFTNSEIEAVWKKGFIVANNDPSIHRKDKCDAWISRSQHGNREHQYGWEIDHIIPKEHDGSDDLENLQPLQWENNLSKSDGRLECVVTSDGSNNKKK